MPRSGASESRHRSWCFTLNNPGVVDCNFMEKMAEDSKYLIVGNEHAWTNGKPKPDGTHQFQGYVIWKNPKTFSATKKFCERAHWEVAKGDAAANIKYCSKEQDFIEFGDRPMTVEEQGKTGADKQREKWKEIRELSKKRKWDELEEKHPRELSVYKGCLNAIAMEYAPCQDMPRNSIVGTWIFGPGGTGKTCYALTEMEPDRSKVYIKDLSKWWDGFRPGVHEHVVIDDFDKYDVKLARQLKIWTQEYEFPAEFKGGSMLIRPKHIVVTSNYRICDIWRDNTTRSTLWRRFHQKVKWTKEGPVEDDVHYEQPTVEEDDYSRREREKIPDNRF